MQITHRLRVAVLTALSLALLSPLAAGAGSHSTPTRVTVAHGAVKLPYVDAAPAGPSVGDVRTVWVALTRPGKKATIGYLSGSLLTVATDRPKRGQELRTSNLVFVIGDAADQIVVGGMTAYAITAPTVAKRSITIRPVLGGSGAFAGARGWCKTVHLLDGTWTHTFTLEA